MTIASRIDSSPVFGWRRLLCALAVLGALALPATAQDKKEEDKETVVTVRAADADKITVAPSGQVQIQLANAPASANGAKLLIVNSANYALWQGDLAKNGNTWNAKLDRPALEALLVANAVQAHFPKGAKDGKDLRISLVRDMFQPALAPTAGLVGKEPLFYDAPEAPEPIEELGANPDPIRVASYAMAARRYDEQLTAYYYELTAARSAAVALWTDLKTAGRLPKEWPDAVMQAQTAAFEALAAKEAAVEKQRQAARAAAKAAVEQWNAAHADADPIELPFREASA